jgi:hypothetical protein
MMIIEVALRYLQGVVVILRNEFERVKVYVTFHCGPPAL